MELEKQVCSLELAKQLRELGVRQYSLWYWVKDADKDVVISDKLLIEAGGGPCCQNVFSAFTVAELGEMLKHLTYPFPVWLTDRWDCDEGTSHTEIASLTEADARANTLIKWLNEKIAMDAKLDWLNR